MQKLPPSDCSLPLDPHPTRPRRTKTRLLTLLLPPTLLVLFCILFFPLYFTQRSSHTTSSSGNSTSFQSAEAITKVGAVWKQNRYFTNLDDFRIEYYSSGEKNAAVLKNGLPRSVSATSGVVRKAKSCGRLSRSGGKAGEGGRCRSKTEKGQKGTGREKARESRKAAKDGNKPEGRKERCEMKRQESSSTTRRTSARSAWSSSTTSCPSPTSTRSSTTTSCTSPIATPTPGSVLSIFYPAHSYTPSALPVGGTQFYALSPFDLTLVSSLTLNYSVFFPASYDFVLGGKLPGLYGGTEGCGGGNAAADCWSTRMAWRSQGVGELYAYLPQDKQNVSALLDVPPYSYVNSDYGISLGRGSFEYARGGWTNVSQTVRLQSTASSSDGVVEVRVNGEVVIRYDQVYWPTGVKGILFSTFFGGSTSDWATPVDQSSFFKDFSVRINALRFQK